MTPLRSLVTVLFLVMVVPLFADVRDDLQGVKEEIEAKRKLLKGSEQDEQRTAGDLARIERTLREREARLHVMTVELGSVEQGLDKTRRDMTGVKGDVEGMRGDIQRRLVALYKAGDVGTPRLIFSAESFPEMVENFRYMQAVVDHDKRAINTYSGRLASLHGMEDILSRDLRRKGQLVAAIEEEKRGIEAERRKKSSHLVKVRKEKQGYQASLQELELNARRLQSMVERLEAESRKSYTQKAEKQRLVSETPSPLVTQGFRKLRGKLSFPVRGELVERFGRHKHDRFNAYTFSNGITLTAPLGSDIRAVSSGRVIFADPFKGYGNMLIIDHGGGYFTLYAHASLLLRKVGSMVARDEVVAKVGDLDSSHGSSLYFELRHQGKPVDPLPWFNR